METEKVQTSVTSDVALTQESSSSGNFAPDDAMKQEYSSLAQHVADLASQAKNGHQLWIGIAGAPGAGKSTLSSRVSSILNSSFGIPTAVIPMDGYHFSKAELDKFPDPKDAHERRGAPFTFDVDRLISDMASCRESMKSGKPFRFPDFDHSVGDPQLNAIAVEESTKVLLFEGNYLLLSDVPWNSIKERFFDDSWFLQVPIGEACTRVAKRHMQAWDWDWEQAYARASGPDRANMTLVDEQSPVNADRIIQSISS